MNKVIMSIVLMTLVLGTFGFVSATALDPVEANGPGTPTFASEEIPDGDGVLTTTRTRHVYQCNLRNKFSHYMSVEGEYAPDSFMYKENSYVYKCYIIENYLDI